MTLTPAQQQARAERIGGSECAMALGLSRRKTALQLYLEKRGELPVETVESDQMWFGTMIEPIVRQWFANKTQTVIYQPEQSLLHPKWDFMVGHIDGFRKVDGGFRGYEGKSATYRVGWGDENTDQVPVDHFMQCQHYMVICGWEVFDIVRYDGHGFRTYEVRADRELQEFIVHGEAEFIRRVRTGDPPPLDYYHHTALGLLKKIYPGTDGSRITATDEAIEWRNEMEEAASLESQAKRSKKAYQAALLNLMGSAALLEFPDGRCMRRQVVQKAAYTVEATSYVDARVIKTPH